MFLFSHSPTHPQDHFATLEFELQSNWIRSLTQLIELNNIKTDLFNFADRLDMKPNAVPLVGNRYFYRSDYQVHRRVNWTSATINLQNVLIMKIKKENTLVKGY
jgi:hypothetical protein